MLHMMLALAVQVQGSQTTETSDGPRTRGSGESEASGEESRGSTATHSQGSLHDQILCNEFYNIMRCILFLCRERAPAADKGAPALFSITK